MDYAQPLKVTWLCRGCHKAVHAANDTDPEVFAVLEAQRSRWIAVLARAREKGWTQNAVARRLRVSTGYLSRCARGERAGRTLLPKAERLVGA